MKIGLIGAGRHGSRYARHLVTDCGDLTLAAIARRSERGVEQAGGWGARYFDDFRDLIAAAEVEAVIAAVPPAANLPIAEACAGAGKPLLVEKPLAATAAAGARLVDLMRAAGVPLTVAQTLRYNPVIRKLRDELPNHGKLYTVYANQRLEPSVLDWLDNPAEAGGGITFHIAVHVFDALRFITGLPITRVAAVCRTCRTANLEDLALIHVEMQGGVAGLVDVSKLSSSRSGRYEFVCENAQLHGEQIHGYVNMVVGTRETGIGRFGPEPTILPLLADWRRFLVGDGKNPVSGEDGLYALRVSEAVVESCTDNRWVEVRPGAADAA